MKFIYAFVLVLIFAGFNYHPDYIITTRATSYTDNLILLKNKQVIYKNVNTREVPVLCYHNIKTNVEGKSPDYTIRLDQFRAHIKMLYDSGYNTIPLDQLYESLTKGVPLPPKPIIITFDDTHLEHYTMAAPVLSHVGFRGVFFAMAVVIGKQGYMTTAQIKLLSDSGHTIGGHTWDHPDLRKLDKKEWDYQLSKPKHQLEQITGKSINCFAYPYGAWNEISIQELKARGITTAFQLSNKQSQKEPMYTIRRLMVAGNWTPDALYKRIKGSFH